MLPRGFIRHFHRVNGNFFLILSFLFFCFCPLTSANAASSESPKVTFATEDLQEEYQLLQEETVISATRYEQPISQSPSNVYVITSKDIQHSGATDIPTLLRRIPGIEVIQMTGAHYDMSVRGNNQERANKLLPMVNGRPFYIDVQGLVFWKGLPVTLQEIERIEVVKGPVSAVYGFNAFDGIVNVITKSPREGQGTTAQLAGGEFDTLTASAIHAGRQDNLGYQLSAGWDQNNQWRNRQGLAFRSYKFNSSFDYPLSESDSLTVEAGAIDINRYDGPTGNILLVNQPYAQNYVRVGFDRNDFFIRAFWSQWDSQFDNLVIPVLSPILVVGDKNGNPTGIPIKSNRYDIDAQIRHNIGGSTKLVGGVNARYNTVSGTTISQFGTERRLGMHGQIELKPFESITINAGSRLDLHNEINPTFSPRLAIIVSPIPNHTIRVSGAVAYRPPTLVETYLRTKVLTTVFGFTTTTFAVGSRNLKPERIISSEIEYQGWFLHHRLRSRLSLFFNHLSDLIGFTSEKPAPVEGPPGNHNQANIYGGEASLEFLITPWLTGLGNASYQQISQTLPVELRRGGPHWKLNGGLRVKGLQGFSGEVMVHYVSSATYHIVQDFATFVGLSLISPSAVPNPRSPSYTLVNLRGAYSFWKDRAEIAISISNALNDRHREHYLGDVIGSRFLGWLTINLGS